MEKLIELLNEYEGQDTWSYDEEMGMPYYGWGDDCDYEAYLISKKYGFVKRLVDNDKIDRDNVKLRKSLWETDTSDIDKIIYTIKNSDYHYVMREAPYEAEETLLMLLSIQDEPIEFLISILKNV